MFLSFFFLTYCTLFNKRLLFQGLQRTIFTRLLKRWKWSMSFSIIKRFLNECTCKSTPIMPKQWKKILILFLACSISLSIFISFGVASKASFLAKFWQISFFRFSCVVIFNFSVHWNVIRVWHFKFQNARTVLMYAYKEDSLCISN